MNENSEGPCDCPFKENCHIPRQDVQDKIRKATGKTIKDCFFHEKMSEGKLEVNLTQPERA